MRDIIIFQCWNFDTFVFANCADSEKKETINFAKNAFFPGITKYQISALMAKQ